MNISELVVGERMDRATASSSVLTSSTRTADVPRGAATSSAMAAMCIARPPSIGRFTGRFATRGTRKSTHTSVISDLSVVKTTTLPWAMPSSRHASSDQ